jgi:hypothetical protein
MSLRGIVRQQTSYLKKAPEQDLGKSLLVEV